MDWFKTMTTNDYIHGVKQHRWVQFSGKLWQRNYYEHIIRDEDELNKLRQYIVDNPFKWSLDQENPAFTGTTLRGRPRRGQDETTRNRARPILHRAPT